MTLGRLITISELKPSKNSLSGWRCRAGSNYSLRSIPDLISRIIILNILLYIALYVFLIKGSIPLSVLTKLHIFSNLIFKMYMYKYLFCRFFWYFLLQLLDYGYLSSTKVRIPWRQGKHLANLYFSMCQLLRYVLSASNSPSKLCMWGRRWGSARHTALPFGSLLEGGGDRKTQGSWGREWREWTNFSLVLSCSFFVGWTY